MSETAQKIKQLIVDKLDINVYEDEFDLNTPLFEGGLAMDSIVFTEFLVLLEQHFGVEIDDEMLATENFVNINKVSETLSKLTA